MSEPMVLRFARGGPGKLVLRTDPDLADVCRTEFSGSEPTLAVRGRTIEITYHNAWWFWGGGARREAAIALSEKAAWRLEVNGGIGKGELDLHRIGLEGLRFDGGIGKLELALGRPRGTVQIVMNGGLAKADIERPRGVPVRVRVGGGAGKLKLDGQTWAGLGGGTDWMSPGYETAADRYDITVNGGCGKMTIEEVS